MLDWIIVGGGIHGTHVAARLIGEAGVSHDRIRLVDPEPRLLERWRFNTAKTGMKHLRSPGVHHLDLEAWSLMRKAGKAKHRPLGLLAAPYDRPALDFFNQHCDAVIQEQGLAKIHVRGKAVRCLLGAQTRVVELESGERLAGKRVVFALGTGHQPMIPTWAQGQGVQPFARHIFDPRGWGEIPASGAIAVVGGGISAAQVALRLAAKGHRVELISRHAFREHQFDSDPGWLGPKYMQAFSAQACYDKRRVMITQARYRGSMPRDVLRALRTVIDLGQVRWHRDEVLDLESQPGALKLKGHGRLLVDRVLLATGFCGRRPGGKMVDELIASASLRCAACGYPIVGRDLAWSQGLHVSGPLAELELGPTSRNIAGARRAGDRLVKVASGLS